MGFGLDFVLFVAFVVASSIYSTWCYNANRRSTLAVILLHTVGNLSLDTFMLPGAGSQIFNVIFVFGAMVITMVWVTRSRKLTNALTANPDSK
jgi:membrane protease YdiL (CAAX protease family)